MNTYECYSLKFLTAPTLYPSVHSHIYTRVCSLTSICAYTLSCPLPLVVYVLAMQGASLHCGRDAPLTLTLTLTLALRSQKHI